MTLRLRKCIAALTLVTSIGGGGGYLAANALHLIPTTADAGDVSSTPVPGKGIISTN
jgi:hypothetical protein